MVKITCIRTYRDCSGKVRMFRGHRWADPEFARIAVKGLYAVYGWCGEDY